MSLLSLATLVFAAVQGPPAGFDLIARYDFVTSNLHISASRRVVAQAELLRPRLDPWRLAGDKVDVSVARLGGPGRIPRVHGLEKPMAAPVVFHDWGPIPEDPSYVMHVDYTDASLAFDWSGCEPGYYKISVTAAFEVNGSRLPNKDVFQMVYWQRTPPPSNLVLAGQKFLSTTIRSQPMPETSGARVPVPKTGSILTTKEVLPNGRHGYRVTLTSGDQDLECDFSNDEGAPRWLHPVMEDASTDVLNKKYLGKTVYPMVRHLRFVGDSSGDVRIEGGQASVVIRGVWRAARDRATHFMLPEVLGGVQDPVHSFLPLYVVFDIARSPGVSWNEDAGTRLITCVADPWEFERVFSLTSMKEDFRDLIDKDNEVPKRLRQGMTPKQVAWLWGWPLFQGTQSETLALTEWRYTPEGDPPHSFFFKEGKLLPGRYVSTN